MRPSLLLVTLLVVAIVLGVGLASLTVSQDPPQAPTVNVPFARLGDVLSYAVATGTPHETHPTGAVLSYALTDTGAKLGADGVLHPAVTIVTTSEVTGEPPQHFLEEVRLADRLTIQSVREGHLDGFHFRSTDYPVGVPALPGLAFQGAQLVANGTAPVSVPPAELVLPGSWSTLGAQVLLREISEAPQLWTHFPPWFWTDARPDLAAAPRDIDAHVVAGGTYDGEAAYQLEWTFAGAVRIPYGSPEVDTLHYQQTESVWLWGRDPYPLERVVRLQTNLGDAPVDETLTRYTRIGFTPGHTALDWGEAALPHGPERASTGGLHPADGTGEALPFALSDALADAAGPAAAPEWVVWRTLNGPVTLVGASFTAGAASWTGAQTHEWRLLYRGADGALFEVRVERATGSDAPVVEAMGEQGELAEIPPLGPQPITIAEAIRLWRAATGNNTDAAPTHVQWGVAPATWTASALCASGAEDEVPHLGNATDRLVTLIIGHTSHGPCFDRSSVALVDVLAVRLDGPTLLAATDEAHDWDAGPEADPTRSAGAPNAAHATPGLVITAPDPVRVAAMTLPLLLAALAVYFAPVLKFGATQGLIVIPAFSRLKRHRILDHQQRDRIHALVQNQPGITPTAICRETGLGWGTVVHHLTTLAANGLVDSRIEGRHRRFFIREDVPVAERTARALLANPGTQRAYAALLDGPAMGPTELGERLGLSAPGALWHLQRLEAGGLVERRRDGRRVRYTPCDAPSRPYDPDEAVEVA